MQNCRVGRTDVVNLYIEYEQTGSEGAAGKASSKLKLKLETPLKTNLGEKTSLVPCFCFPVYWFNPGFLI
jgi:hypothetical protein